MPIIDLTRLTTDEKNALEVLLTKASQPTQRDFSVPFFHCYSLCKSTQLILKTMDNTLQETIKCEKGETSNIEKYTSIEALAKHMQGFIQLILDYLEKELAEFERGVK